VIDPVLRYGTYVGGHSRDLASAIAVDVAGSAYVAGYTVSADFPVTEIGKPLVRPVRLEKV